MSFSIAETMLDPLHAHVRQYGGEDAEAGGFLLGSYDDATATVLALAEGLGVERSRGLFRISGRAMERLFAFADDENLRVWAQVHSHPRGSFLSLTDETDGFRVPDFLSGVIPQYAEPPREPQSWGWWTFRHGEWQPADNPGVANRPSRVVTFDEEGVR
jgi:hypothetical protein